MKVSAASIAAVLSGHAVNVFHISSVQGDEAADRSSAHKAAFVRQLFDLGVGELPVCMAKTQYSFSDDQTKLGRPTGFEITVRDVKLSAGAGFIVVFTGNILTMPGLPKVPAANSIDVDENGNIVGLF